MYPQVFCYYSISWVRKFNNFAHGDRQCQYSIYKHKQEGKIFKSQTSISMHRSRFNVYLVMWQSDCTLPRNLVSPPQNVPISGVCLFFTLDKKMWNICSIWQMFCLLFFLPVSCYAISIKVLHIALSYTVSAHPSYFTLSYSLTVSSSFVDAPSSTGLVPSQADQPLIQ